MSPRRRHAEGPFYRLEIPPEVADAVRGLPPEVKRQIKQAFVQLSETPEVGKLLTGELAGFRSYPARRFRIVYQLTASERRLVILRVGFHRTIYEELTRRLRGSQPPA